jgi:hypothetical protein
MAVSTTTYFSNAIVGIPQVAGELVDIYETTSAPRFAIGTKFERQDGAIFRYAYFGSYSSASMVVASVASDYLISTVSSACLAGSATYQMPNENPGLYPGAVGSRYFICNGSGAVGGGSTIATVSLTANQLRGGYVAITSGAGVGYTYRIKSNTATGNPAAGLTRFELYEPLVAAVNTSTQLYLAGNKYNDLIPTIHSIAFVPAGIAVSTQAGGTYGWVLQKGVCGVLGGAAAMGSAGALAQLTTSAVGSIGINTVALNSSTINALPIIGVIIAGNSGSMGVLVDVNIA